MIPNYTDPRRGTGRTTRAVKHAIELAESGKRVWFCCLRETWDSLLIPTVEGRANWESSYNNPLLFLEGVGRIEHGSFNAWDDTIDQTFQRRERLRQFLSSGEVVIDHWTALFYHETFRDPRDYIHAYDHDNREIPALPSPAKARQWLCSLEVEFAWKPALGADLALVALKDAQDAEVRIVLLDAMDRWTRGGALC